MLTKITKISHAGLPRRFFKIGTQNTDIAIIKKVPFFSKNSEIETRGTWAMLKRTPFYREILVGDDNISGSSGTPGPVYLSVEILHTGNIIYHQRTLSSDFYHF